MAQTLHHGDCLAILPMLANKSIHLAFIDLPYGLGIAEWDKELSGLEAISLCRDKLVDGGSMYATCTAHILPELIRHFDVRRLIVWAKPNLPLRKTLNEWEWSTEYVIWETKGEPRCFNKPPGESGRDYWRIPVENGFLNTDNLTHPARKPIALMRRIVQASTMPGDVVLDPFMGSGTTGVAAVHDGRNFIGIEKDIHHFATAKKRIDRVQPSLFSFDAMLSTPITQPALLRVV
jgi:DNA modification methylase